MGFSQKICDNLQNTALYWKSWFLHCFLFPCKKRKWMQGNSSPFMTLRKILLLTRLQTYKAFLTHCKLFFCVLKNSICCSHHALLGDTALQSNYTLMRASITNKVTPHTGPGLTARSSYPVVNSGWQTSLSELTRKSYEVITLFGKISRKVGKTSLASIEAGAMIF